MIIIGTDDGDRVVGANYGSSIHALPVIVSSEQKLWYQIQEVVLLVVHAQGLGHEFTSSMLYSAMTHEQHHVPKTVR